MGRISLSGEQRTIESILSWYDDQLIAIKDYRNKIIDVVIQSNSKIKIDVKFIGLTLTEINDYFNKSEEELKHLICLNLLSATEAFLRVDYNIRVSKKDKSDIGREFRKIDKKKKKKVSLEDDIVEIWRDNTKEKIFSDFLGILNYRHWLAHGRYWIGKFGRVYSVDDAHQIANGIFTIISSY
jgi:hypothetical protein